MFLYIFKEKNVKVLTGNIGLAKIFTIYRNK